MSHLDALLDDAVYTRSRTRLLSVLELLPCPVVAVGVGRRVLAYQREGADEVGVGGVDKEQGQEGGQARVGGVYGAGVDEALTEERFRGEAEALAGLTQIGEVRGRGVRRDFAEDLGGEEGKLLVVWLVVRIF